MLPEIPDSELQRYLSPEAYSIVKIIIGLLTDVLHGIIDLDQFLVCLENLPSVKVQVQYAEE